MKVSEVLVRPSVSIPFKREGLSELYAGEWDANGRQFQFPSNGKDFLNISVALFAVSSISGFNSLQTGRTF